MGIESSIRKAGIVLLAAVMIMECLPLYGGAVYAADDEIAEKIVELSDEELEQNKEKAKAEVEKELGIVDADEDEEADAEALPSVPIRDADPGDSPVIAEKGLGALKLDGYDDTGQFIFADDEPDAQGNVNIYSTDLTGTGFYYTRILVGDEPSDILDDYARSQMMEHTLVGADQYQFSKTVDTKYFSVGYHTIFVGISNGSEEKWAIVRKVPTYIYESVSNSISNYYTYPTKFTYRFTDSTYYSTSGEYLSMFMDYRKKGSKSWSKYVYRMDNSYTDYEKKGLKANTTYQVRLMLGKTFTYDGTTYTFTGRQTKHASSAKTIKTAYKKPKVSKIDISKVKQWCRKYRVQYAWKIWYNKRTGVIVRRKALYHTYRYWYTRFKVTVKFKKKQGIAGVHIYTINNLNWRLGGNKKSYSKTFTASGKKKGKKITVRVQNYRSKTYGGWSKKLSKRVRCR